VAAVVHPIASARPSGTVRVSGVGLQWRRRTSSVEPVVPTPSYSAARQGPTSLLMGWAFPIRTRVKGPMGRGGEINPTHCTPKQMPQLGSRERWCSPRRNLPARGGGNGILSRAPAAIGDCHHRRHRTQPRNIACGAPASPTHMEKTRPVSVEARVLMCKCNLLRLRLPCITISPDSCKKRPIKDFLQNFAYG
jgi:hypothetical protein